MSPRVLSATRPSGRTTRWVMLPLLRERRNHPSGGNWSALWEKGHTKTGLALPEASGQTVKTHQGVYPQRRAAAVNKPPQKAVSPQLSTQMLLLHPDRAPHSLCAHPQAGHQSSEVAWRPPCSLQQVGWLEPPQPTAWAEGESRSLQAVSQAVVVPRRGPRPLQLCTAAFLPSGSGGSQRRRSGWMGPRTQPPKPPCCGRSPVTCYSEARSKTTQKVVG